MRKYDNDFKQNAVKKVIDGQSVASVSRELGVNESLIHKWKRESIQNSNQNSAAEEKENASLKKRIKELEMENQILKKAAIIFGRGS